AAKRGYELTHRARQFKRTDFDRFDLVLAMDLDNLEHLRRLAGSLTVVPPIRLLRSFDPSAPLDSEVPDPYSGAGADFAQVLELDARALHVLLEYCRERL